jgi:hypothetical protein
MPMHRRTERRSGGDGIEAMRGIVIFAIMFAIGAVIDAAFFKGRYLNDAQTAITGLTGLSTQIGKK